MKALMETIEKARQIKPAFGEPCNHCGWCCLTEVCQMGEFHGAKAVLPCEFLRHQEGKYLCGLMLDGIMDPEVMNAGGGCDAKTQQERFRELAIEIR